MRKLNGWFVAAIIFALGVVAPGIVLYREYHPASAKVVLSTVILLDGTSIICPDPNYNPHYMDGAVTVTYDIASGLTTTTVGTETPVFPEPVTKANITHMNR